LANLGELGKKHLNNTKCFEQQDVLLVIGCINCALLCCRKSW